MQEGEESHAINADWEKFANWVIRQSETEVAYLELNCLPIRKMSIVQQLAFWKKFSALKTRELKALESCSKSDNACYENEIACLISELAEAGRRGVSEADPLYEDIRTTSVSAEGEEQCCGEPAESEAEHGWAKQ